MIISICEKLNLSCIHLFRFSIFSKKNEKIHSTENYVHVVNNLKNYLRYKRITFRKLILSLHTCISAHTNTLVFSRGRLEKIRRGSDIGIFEILL